MSGFSAEWLALREPADHRARNPAILAGLGARFADRDRLSTVDLGCGAGSNLRAMAPALPREQHWLLIDHDQDLLDEAGRRIAAWADRAQRLPSGLDAFKGDRRLAITFRQADLSGNVGALLPDAVDLVTAAALFDLASAAWIRRLAQAVAERNAAFYTALTYDGAETWSPPHPADGAILAAFHLDQGRDKGFGPAAGPRAPDALAAAFRGEGYEVVTGSSAWRLSPGTDGALLAELAEGTAAAVRGTGSLPDAVVAAWLEARRSGAACTVGHADLAAYPLA
jgi:hypothetical protein